MAHNKFEFICVYCSKKFFCKQRRERKFCCIQHFRDWSKGKINKKPLSGERKKKISVFQKNRKRTANSKKHNKNISKARKGIKFSKEHREKLSSSKANSKKVFFSKQEKYFSKKTNELNYSHSSYETIMMEVFDQKTDIKYWTKNHKIRIKYVLDGIVRNYIPDFFVEYFDGKKELIEVKGYIYNLEMFNAKKNACLDYCSNNSIKYKILFKEDIYNEKKSL